MKVFTSNFNKSLVKVNYTMHNDGIHSYSINMTYESLVVIRKLWAYFTVRVPRDANDQSYQKEFIKTSIDVEKLIGGSRSNFVVSTIADICLKSAEQDIKFPLKKVSARSHNSFVDFFSLSGRLSTHQHDLS
jgi:hypothetical protein